MNRRFCVNPKDEDQLSFGMVVGVKVLCQSSTGLADPRAMKRTYVVLSFRREQGPSGP
jgi:hypothetical protein